MAQLVLIKTESIKNKVNDIVSIKETSFKFSDYEKTKFNFILIPSLTQKECVDCFQSFFPKVKRLWKATTTKYTDKPPEKFDVWQDGEKWLRIKNDYAVRTIRDLSEADRAILASLKTDKKTALSIIKKATFSFMLHPDNKEEIKEIV